MKNLNIFNNQEIYTTQFLNEYECELIKKYIIKNESIIKSMGPDIYSGTSDDSLTGRYYIFNCLNEPYLNKILEPKFISLFEKLKLEFPIYIQCWPNLYRYGDYIKPHMHSRVKEFLSANIFISGNNIPGTFYHFNNGKNIQNIENETGCITLFSSKLVHAVRPYNNRDTRITLGVDIHNDSKMEKEFKSHKLRYYKINNRYSTTCTNDKCRVNMNFNYF